MSNSSNMSEYKLKQQLLTLCHDFDSFRYNIITYLDKLSCNQCSSWDGLKIVELDEEIYVGNIENDKIVSSITFSKKDNGHVKIFLVQIRDDKGSLRPHKVIAIDGGTHENSNVILKIPTNEEIKVINTIFKKVKNMTYGIKDKKQEKGLKKDLNAKRRTLVKPSSFGSFDED